jgi:hypothetical protein
LNVYAPDPDLGWKLRSDARASVDWLGRAIVVRTDEHGHRVPEGPTQGHGPALVFAGDSYTFGNEVEAQETFAWQTGRLLGLPAVNLGVGGYSLDQACRSLERYLSHQDQPVHHSLLAVFIGNDIEYGAAPVRPTHVDDSGHLVESSRSPALRDLVVRSRILFFAFKAREAVEGRWVQARAEPTPSHRWIYDETAWTPASLDSHRRSLARLRAVARGRSVPLTVLLLPERAQVYGQLSDLPNRKLMALLQSLEIPALDLLPRLRACALSDPDLFHHGPAGHFSPSGHAQVAFAVSGFLRPPSHPGKERAG